MKQCPNCGYKPTPPNTKLRKLYDKYFPDMPIADMVQRKWIGLNDPSDLEEVLDKLMEFFDCKTVDAFREKFGYEGELFDFE